MKKFLYNQWERLVSLILSVSALGYAFCCLPRVYPLALMIWIVIVLLILSHLRSRKFYRFWGLIFPGVIAAITWSATMDNYEWVVAFFMFSFIIWFMFSLNDLGFFVAFLLLIAAIALLVTMKFERDKMLDNQPSEDQIETVVVSKVSRHSKENIFVYIESKDDIFRLDDPYCSPLHDGDTVNLTISGKSIPYCRKK